MEHAVMRFEVYFSGRIGSKLRPWLSLQPLLFSSRKDHSRWLPAGVCWLIFSDAK